jgi:hypothetical protein
MLRETASLLKWDRDISISCLASLALRIVDNCTTTRAPPLFIVRHEISEGMDRLNDFPLDPPSQKIHTEVKNCRSLDSERTKDYFETVTCMSTKDRFSHTVKKPGKDIVKEISEKSESIEESFYTEDFTHNINDSNNENSGVLQDLNITTYSSNYPIIKVKLRKEKVGENDEHVAKLTQQKIVLRNSDTLENSSSHRAIEKNIPLKEDVEETSDASYPNIVDCDPDYDD